MDKGGGKQNVEEADIIFSTNEKKKNYRGEGKEKSRG